MSSENVLVVALDGLDIDLINEFGLDFVKQSEFGGIDNRTNINEIKTSELFASFITGTNYEEHGVSGLTGTPDTWKWDLIERLAPDHFRHNVRGFHRFSEVLKWVLRPEDEYRYTKEDIKSETVFESIENSRSMFVPSYNPDILWEAKFDFKAIELGYGKSANADCWDERSYEIRKKKLFSELENDIISPRDFLMVHFHRPDLYHHMYQNPETGEYDEEKLRKVYRETDELAKEIKEKSLDAGYDTVIFMSDHGLPKVKEHNENAFYSCNRELFGDEVPKITEFHDRILELVNGSGK